MTHLTHTISLLLTLLCWLSVSAGMLIAGNRTSAQSAGNRTSAQSAVNRTSAQLADKSQALTRRQDLVYGQLDNGLTYYILHNEQPRGEAVYRLMVRSGSLNEEDHQRGLAHFLEHMAFNGSQHFPGDAMVRFLESKGARFGHDLNAHTTFDETIYKLQLPSTSPQVVDSTMLILADWAYGLTLSQEEVEKERGVILSEWLTKQNADESTNWAMLQELFNGSRYAVRNAIGDTAIIAHATPELLRQYYEACYLPSQMAVAVVGDVDTTQVRATITRLFASWQPSDQAATHPRYTIPSYGKTSAHLATAKNEKKIQFEVYTRIDPVGPIRTGADMQGYALRLVTSRLIRQRLARYSFDEYHYSDGQIGRGGIVEGGDVWLASTTLQHDDLRAGIRNFLRCQEQIMRYGFTAHEIAGICHQLLKQKRRSLRYPTPSTSVNLMGDIYNDYMRGACCISDSAELSWLETWLPTIDSLRVLNYLGSLRQHRHSHYLLRGNPKLLEQFPKPRKLKRCVKEALRAEVTPFVDEPASADSTLSRPDAPTRHHITRTDTLPQIQAVRWLLDNGCDVTYRRNDDDHDRLMLTGFREAGLYHLDSLDYLAGLYAGAIIPISGAGTFSRNGLSDFLRGSSASMSMLVDKNRTGISGAARTEDVELLFQLLYTKWTQPRLDPEAYNRVIEQIRSDIRHRTITPDDTFVRQNSRMLQTEDYTTRLLTLDELDQCVSPERLLPLYDRLFGSADGFHFILAGDLPTDSVRQWCDLWLGALPGTPRDYTQTYHPDYCLTRDTLYQLTTESEKTVVSLSWQQSLDDYDFGSQGSIQHAQLVLDMIKGVLNARLRQVLREEMSMTYSVGTSASCTLHPASLWRTTVAFSCLPQHTDTLLRATDAVLQDVLSHPDCWAQTLDDVRSNLLKQHRLDMQRNTWWTGYIRNLIYNEEPDWDFVNNYEQEVAAITADDLCRHMARMLQAPRLTAIKMGQAAADATTNE